MDASATKRLSPEDCQRWLTAVRIGDVTDNLEVVQDGIANYRALKNQEKQMERLRDKIKDAIAQALDELNISDYTCEYGTAAYREGYTRITYEADKLDALMREKPEIAELLIDYRKETPVAGGLVIS